jgi:signal transduction histidine kinase/DNA-binding CsgD family transcriptional regulator
MTSDPPARPDEEQPTASVEPGTDDDRFRALVEQIPAIVYIWNASAGLDDAVDEYVSPHIEQVLGFPPEDWIEDPRLWIERLHPEDRADVIAETSRSVDAGDPFRLEYRMIAKDGRIVWLHDEASVVGGDAPNGRGRYVGVQLDFTERKRQEHAQRHRDEEVTRFDRRRRRLLESLVETQENERRRAAEVIQEETVRRLSGVQTLIDAIVERDPALERLDELQQLRQQLVDVAAGLRDVVFDLHPSILETEGLVRALSLHVERWRTARVPEVREDDRLTTLPSKETRSLLYRIAHEALTNVRDHADATRVTISLEHRDGGFLLVIQDDGRGFDVEPRLPARSGAGIASMGERAQLAGGWAGIRSARGGGTRVEIWLPEIDALASVRRRRLPGDPETEEEEQEASTEATPIAGLTPREAEVARLLALGHTNVEIAAILYLSVRTIEQHRAHVFRKLGVRSRAALVQRLREQANDSVA